MPVWGVWLDGAWYFSTSHNFAQGPQPRENSKCVVCNENVEEAVILEGTAQRLKEEEIPSAGLERL